MVWGLVIFYDQGAFSEDQPQNQEKINLRPRDRFFDIGVAF